MQEQDELTLFIRRLTALNLPYMVTGATAAIIYGQPRVTNDLDVVLALDDPGISKLIEVFPEADFYLPPSEVIRSELARTQRGHLNIIHHESGYKADVYLAGRDPLHRWALPLRRMITWTEELTLQVAPPEYVILRKLEYFREGGSSKHPADIQAQLMWIVPSSRTGQIKWGSATSGLNFNPPPRDLITALPQSDPMSPGR